MEFVDIVDDNCSVIDRVSKQEAHAKGLLHKTIIAEIINSQGEMLLVKPKNHKQDAGQFVSPVGGHVAAGEADEDALKREAWEEMGMKNFKYEFKGRAVLNRYILNRQENHYFILYETFSDLVPILSDESESFKWFSKEKLKQALKTDRKNFGAAFLFVVKTFYPEMLEDI